MGNSVKVLGHQDNAPAHTSVIAMVAINDCCFELIQYPPYSPDLAPSEFIYPFSGTHFQSDDYVIHAVEDFRTIKKRTSLKVELRSFNIATTSG